MDREKVIKELNTDVLPFLQHHCDMQCDREKRWISKMIITVHDALALLKEQGAAEPNIAFTRVNGTKAFSCPRCSALIYGGSYCSHCGQALKGGD